MRPTTIRLVTLIALVAAACGDTEGTEPAPRAPEAAQPAPLVAPEETVPPASTAPPATELPTTASTTTDTSPSTTKSPTATVSPAETTTTTTSAPPEDEPEAPCRLGYRVVGIAADDVLDLRSAPSVEYQIVGTLLPDATGIEVPERQGDWALAVLADGTEGWVPSAHLAIDEAWRAPFESVPCAGADEAWGGTQRSPQPAAPSDSVFVHGYEYLASPECDRLVIRLGTFSRDPISRRRIHNAAATIPAGVEVTSGSNRVTVSFPDGWSDVLLFNTDADFGEARLFAIAPMETTGRLAVELLHGSQRIAHGRFLDDPARIIIDIRPSPDPAGVDLSPAIGRTFVLTEPALWDGSRFPARLPLVVTGFGRANESDAIATLRRLDGEGEVTALWNGGFDCIDEYGASIYRGDTYCFGAGPHPWEEFAVTIDELEPGSYRLTLADAYAADGDLQHDFVVGLQPDPGPWSAAAFVGRTAVRIADEDAPWDRVFLDGEPLDLVVEPGDIAVPGPFGYMTVYKTWIVAAEPVDYAAPDRPATVMAWLVEDIDDTTVLDVLTIDVTPDAPLQVCIQHDISGPAHPLLLRSGDAAWAVGDLTPFEVSRVRCSAG